MSLSSSSSSSSSETATEVVDHGPVPWMHGAAGIMGGAIAMTMFYPLDLIRTRLHAQTATAGSNKFKNVADIAKQEGFKGLYRGVRLAVCAHSIGWGLYLTSFRSCQQSLAAHNGGPSTQGDFFSACIAACFTSTLVTPLNVLKTRAQLHKDKSKKHEGFFSGAKTIVKTEGSMALLKGVGPQILLSSHTTIQVALYEFIKRRLWGTQDAPLLGVALASGMSKAVASVICNPLEVCRTRLQDKSNAGNKDYASMGVAFRTIFRTEGVRGLYRGVFVNACRVIPTTVVAFILYEQLLRLMKSTKQSPPVISNTKEEGENASNTQQPHRLQTQ